MEMLIDSVPIPAVITFAVILFGIGMFVWWIIYAYSKTKSEETYGYLTPKMQKKFRDQFNKSITEKTKK